MRVKPINGIMRFIYFRLLLVLSLICFFAISQISFGQTTMFNTKYGQQVFLDDHLTASDSIAQVDLKVVYQVKSVIDTLDKTLVNELMLLEIGDGVTKFSSYSKFRLDSTWRHHSDAKPVLLAAKLLTSDVFPLNYFEAIYHNYRLNVETVTGRVVASDFVYEEPLPKMTWDIQGDTDVWNGHFIQKARCFFRGREYEAWFTPEIPAPYGPWKFYGLPGLIVRVSDIDNHYSFEAARITSEESGAVLYPRYQYQKVKREEYLKAKQLIIANYPLYQSYYNNGTGIRISPPPGYVKKALGNDLIEKD